MMRLRGDFNGCWDGYLCLSHSDEATDEHGAKVTLAEGMRVLAFEFDSMPGDPPEYLVVTGETVRSPEPLCSNGSRWAVKIDSLGVRRVARLCDA